MLIAAFMLTVPSQAFAEASEAPEVYKDPGDETVDIDGDCLFIAKATNYTTAKWIFTKDGETVEYDKAEERFPGLKVEFGNSTTLSLKNIPAELDGWAVSCLFGNDGNETTLSSSAMITVEGASQRAEEQQISEESPTPEPTSDPEAVPVYGSDEESKKEDSVPSTAGEGSAPQEAETAIEENIGGSYDASMAEEEVSSSKYQEKDTGTGNRALHSLLIVIGIIVLFMLTLILFMIRDAKRNKAEMAEEKMRKRKPLH